MKILLHEDLILSFLVQNPEYKQYQHQITQILNNEQSVFLYSKKYFSYIQEKLNEDEVENYQRFVTKLSDSIDADIQIQSNTNSQCFEDEFIHIFSSIPDKIIGTISLQLPSESLKNNIPNIATLSLQKKPNYDWLLINLAILHPNKVSTSCFDFTTNQEVDNFFKDIFKIPKHINIVHIFDTQCNLAHNKFDSIATKKMVHYYTKFVSTKRNPTGNIDNKKFLKQKFGSKHKMLTISADKAHGRRIIFEHLIITCDNDYWNLEVNASDWEIDVQYSIEKANTWLTRVTYTEYRS
jgi:hypothetical protein